MAGFYSTLFEKLDANLNAYVGETSSTIMSAISPVATTLACIYICLWGWSMMRGMISEPMTDAVTRIVRLSLIVTISTVGSYYSNFLADWLWSTPDAVGSLMASGDSTSNLAFLDSFWEKTYDLGAAYMAKAKANSTFGVPDLTLTLAGTGIWAAGVVCTAYAAFLLVLSKMALAILLGIGPIFVLLLIFESTKRFFDAWAGQTLNYIFLTLLVAAAVRLILTLINAYITAQGEPADPSVSEAVPAIALCLIGFLVLIQLPSIASALGGGVAVSTLGAAGSALSYGRRFAGAGASGARDVATGRTLSDLRGARRTKAMNANWAARNPGVVARTFTRSGSVAREAPNASSGRRGRTSKI